MHSVGVLNDLRGLDLPSTRSNCIARRIYDLDMNVWHTQNYT